MSFLRKQQSRLLCVCTGVPVEQRGAKVTRTPPLFWIPACAGMTRWPGFAGTGLSRARGEASCFIWLKCYGSTFPWLGSGILTGMTRRGFHSAERVRKGSWRGSKDPWAISVLISRCGNFLRFIRPCGGGIGGGHGRGCWPIAWCWWYLPGCLSGR